MYRGSRERKEERIERKEERREKGEQLFLLQNKEPSIWSFSSPKHDLGLPTAEVDVHLSTTFRENPCGTPSTIMIIDDKEKKKGYQEVNQKEISCAPTY